MRSGWARAALGSAVLAGAFAATTPAEETAAGDPGRDVACRALGRPERAVAPAGIDLRLRDQVVLIGGACLNVDGGQSRSLF